MAFSTCIGRQLAYTCQKHKVHQPEVKDQTELELNKHSMKIYELLLVMTQFPLGPVLANNLFLNLFHWSYTTPGG